MKTTNLFKALALAALTVVSSFNVEALAQDTNFITNEEVENNLVVAKTIYKQDGNYLYNHMRYEFTYDDANRLVSKTASKWDGTTDKWAPYFQMTYRYESDEIIMSYARWDENRQTFSKDGLPGSRGRLGIIGGLPSATALYATDVFPPSLSSSQYTVNIDPYPVSGCPVQRYCLSDNLSDSCYPVFGRFYS